METFQRQILRLMRKRRRRTTNLLPFQRRALSILALRTDVLVVYCDKILGPALIDTAIYVSRAFTDHLSNTGTYRELTEEEATLHMRGVATKLKLWLKNTPQA